MKKIILPVILVTLYYFPSLAQPILTDSSYNPVAGDKFYSHLFNITGPAFGDSGANVFWDFYSISEHSNDSIVFQNPIGTPYSDSFPDATICYNDRGTYYYYATDTSRYSFIGNQNYTYSNRADLMRYPFTYRSDFTDTSTLFSSTYNSTHIYHFHCDGYGTLRLPTGIYHNVLRVKVIFKDSVVVWPSTVTTTGISYRWYMPGMHNMLLSMNIDVTGGIERATDGVYYTDAADPQNIGTANNHQYMVSVYPNPGVGDINVVFDLYDARQASLKIMNVTGQTLQTFTDLNSGVNSITLHSSDMPSGLYVAALYSKEGIFLKKFTVIR